MHWVMGVGHRLLQEAGQGPESPPALWMGRWGKGGWRRIPAHCAGVMGKSSPEQAGQVLLNNPKCLHSRESRGVLTLGCLGRRP